jgi:hypothetical protein
VVIKKFEGIVTAELIGYPERKLIKYTNPFKFDEIFENQKSKFSRKTTISKISKLNADGMSKFRPALERLDRSRSRRILWADSIGFGH